jgi:4-hydroxy-tetrahydrodipicolinate reductase
MRIALVGSGRMSQAVQALARTRGVEIATVISGAENRSGEALTAERLAGAEVVLEFTRPASAPGNLLRLAALGARVVTGTTGWDDRLREIATAISTGGGALIHAANFSVGVQLFLRAAGQLSGVLRGRPEFDGYILEAHHRHKVDAPSGTALRLQVAAREGDPAREFPISSVRAGTIPGIHALCFDGAGEAIRFEHTAHSRESFAAGALAAAEWIRSRRGVYRFEEMLFGAIQ